MTIYTCTYMEAKTARERGEGESEREAEREGGRERGALHNAKPQVEFCQKMILYHHATTKHVSGVTFTKI
jgi:hypothetical protein